MSQDLFTHSHDQLHDQIRTASSAMLAAETMIVSAKAVAELPVLDPRLVYQALESFEPPRSRSRGPFVPTGWWDAAVVDTIIHDVRVAYNDFAASYGRPSTTGYGSGQKSYDHMFWSYVQANVVGLVPTDIGTSLRGILADWFATSPFTVLAIDGTLDFERNLKRLRRRIQEYAARRRTPNPAPSATDALHASVPELANCVVPGAP